MFILRIVVIVLLMAGINGCSTHLQHTTSKNPLPDFKIAIIADSQITTKNFPNKYIYRDMRTDALVNVAVRTTFQEMLAPEHLGYMLEDVANQNPDLILYLGDAVNSGCKDEFDAFFRVVDAFKASTGLPMFMVVGNHDYLATGNQADKKARKEACGNKSYYTKADVVKTISKFNNDSFERKKNDKIVSFIDNVKNDEVDVNNNCELPEDQQHLKGCFYGGLIGIKSDNSRFDIALVDTSDYKDVHIPPEVKSKNYYSLYGLRGSISWVNGQTNWFQKHTNPDDSLRVIASHYPVTKLGWSRFYSSRPGDLMLKDGYNVWLSAHTHESVPNNKVQHVSYGQYGKDWKPASHINVGSTTDFKPHSAIAKFSRYSDSVEKEVLVSIGNDEIKSCESKLKHYLNSQSVDMQDERKTYDSLGLTKAYRKKGYDMGSVRKNIEIFLTEKEVHEDRETWVRCLMYVAAKNEK